VTTTCGVVSTTKELLGGDGSGDCKRDRSQARGNGVGVSGRGGQSLIPRSDQVVQDHRSGFKQAIAQSVGVSFGAS